MLMLPGLAKKLTLSGHWLVMQQEEGRHWTQAYTKRDTAYNGRLAAPYHGFATGS